LWNDFCFTQSVYQPSEEMVLLIIWHEFVTIYVATAVIRDSLWNSPLSVGNITLASVIIRGQNLDRIFLFVVVEETG